MYAATRVHRGFDDSYITYRYAWNLAHGYGLVYNPGEPVLSTTTPLLAIVLAGAELLGARIPRAADVLGVLGLMAIVAGLRPAGRGWALLGWCVSAVLLLSWPSLIVFLGGEMALYLALGVWAIRTDGQDRTLLSGFLSGMAALARPDGLLVACIVGGRRLLSRQLSWRWILGVAIPLISWSAYAVLAFGSPLPWTLYAKRQQALMTITTTFSSHLARWTIEDLGQPAHWPFWVAIVLGVLWSQRAVRLSLLWVSLYLLGYSLLAVPRYPWYFAPLGLGLALAAGNGLSTAVAFLHRRVTPGALRWGLIGLAAVVVLIPAGEWAPASWSQQDQRVGPYRDVGQWLAENTPADASIGMLEVGIMGYYAQRRVVDFAGLIQPDVAVQMSTGSTYAGTTRWAINRYSPDYVVLLGEGAPPSEEPWFASRYRQVRRVPAAAASREITIWADRSLAGRTEER